MYQNILVAYDGSDAAKRALAHGLDLVRSLGGRLTSITVQEELPKFAASLSELDEAQRQFASHFDSLVQEAAETASRKGVELETVVLAGKAVPQIAGFAAREGIDLLIVGYTGHSVLHNVLAGNTVQNLVSACPCAVLVVK